MERAAAIKKLTKLLGKKLGYRVNDKAPTPEQREEAKAALPGAIANRNDWAAQRDARYKALLEGDTEYQRLKANTKAAGEALDKLRGICSHYKITVGISESIFFVVKAEGDSWEEIIQKLTKTKES